MYALIVVIFFLFVVMMTENIRTELYFESYGVTAVEQKEHDFFYGAAGYHTKTPLVSIESDEFDVYFYEVVRKTEDVFQTYVYILIYDHQNQIKLSEDIEYFLSFKVENQEESYDIAIRQFRYLDLFVGAYLDNNQMSALLPKSAFFNQAFSILEIISESETSVDILMETAIDMKESDFIIEDIINDYQVSEYQTYGVYEAIIHKTDEFAYVSFLGIGGYLILVAVVTYFVFFFNYRKMFQKFNQHKKGKQ